MRPGHPARESGRRKTFPMEKDDDVMLHYALHKLREADLLREANRERTARTATPPPTPPRPLTRLRRRLTHP